MELGRETLLQHGNLLHGYFNIYGTTTRYNNYVTKCTTSSKKYVFCNNSVSLDLMSDRATSGIYLLFVKFQILKSDACSYTLTINSTRLGIQNKKIYSDKGTWQLISNNTIINTENSTVNVDITFEVDIQQEEKENNLITTLYEDTEMTDFTLRGHDGSVNFHKVVLAASSPFMKRMLTGPWKEAAEGQVDVPDTSQLTLQHLKEYMYLQRLPETGLEYLMQLATYYIMPDLKRKSLEVLVETVAKEDSKDILQYAGTSRLTKIIGKMLQQVEQGSPFRRDILEGNSKKTPMAKRSKKS